MNRKYTNKLLVIAVPIMLSNIISQVQMIIDRIFLGQMDPLYMSALGNVSTPMWTTMSFCFSLSTGASILISQNVGAGNKENIEKYAAALIKWSNLIPVLLFFFWTFFAQNVFHIMGVSDKVMPLCLGYMKYYAPIFIIVGLEASVSVIMQTSNYTKPLIYYGLVRAGLNIVLDWIMIFGRFGFPRMGIEGAALATMISEYVGCLVPLYVILKSDLLITRPSFKNTVIAPLKPFLHSAKLGVNTALEDFAWNLGNLVIMRILNSINEMAAGIYSIVFSIELLIVVIIGSIGNATMTLTGEAKGRKDVAQFTGVCKIAYMMSAAVSLVTLLICVIFPRQILSLFTSDTEIIATCGIYLILVCLNLFGKSGNIIIGNGIRGNGEPRWMFFTQIFGTIFIICTSSLFVYVLKLGMLGVFLAVILDELSRAIINLCKIIRITKSFD